MDFLFNAETLNQTYHMYHLLRTWVIFTRFCSAGRGSGQLSDQTLTPTVNAPDVLKTSPVEVQLKSDSKFSPLNRKNDAVSRP